MCCAATLRRYSSLQFFDITRRDAQFAVFLSSAAGLNVGGWGTFFPSFLIATLSDRPDVELLLNRIVAFRVHADAPQPHPRHGLGAAAHDPCR